jgi:3D (Asp-Asp-Asp) domain-containing protein/peptidoglycan hydrolase CwlO-like protein
MWRRRTKSPISADSRPQQSRNILICECEHTAARLLGSPLVRGGRESRLALGLALAAAILLGASLAGAENTAKLQRHQGALATKSHTALLGLYALDSRLAQTHAQLARIHARAVGLRAQQAQLREELTVVARNLRASQSLLGTRLRTLYENGEPNAIAILLGSASLDDAVTRLNDLDQSARQDASTIADAQAGKAELTRLAGVLAARVRQVRALELRAQQTTAALTAARAQRVSYLASLAQERKLTRRQIARLDSRARRVVKRAQVVQAAEGPPVFVSAQTLTVTATGYSLPGHTATGLPVGFGVVAVDPSVIPLGTRMTIPGYGEGVAADTGGAVSGYTIDLWFPTLAGALAWGRRTVTITLH